jgi:hypothetical protein
LKVSHILTLGLVLLSSANVQASEYKVSVVGPAFSLSGEILFADTGTLTAPAFGASVQSYLINAYVNNVLVQTFSPENSTWGGTVGTFSFGSSVDFTITSESITVSSRNTTLIATAGDVFLNVNEPVGVYIPNLHLFQGQLFLFYVNNGDRYLLQQPVAPNLLLASPVPEPRTGALLLLGIVSLAACQLYRPKRKTRQ